MPSAEKKQRTVKRLRRLNALLQEHGAPLHVRRMAHTELVSGLICAFDLSGAASLALTWDLHVVTESEGGMVERVLGDIDRTGYDTAHLRDLLREADEGNQQNHDG